MPLTTKSYRLVDERDRLNSELDDLADTIVDGDHEKAVNLLKQRASSLETQLSGVCWLIDQYGGDSQVVVAGLDAGEYAQVQDRVEQIRATSDGRGNTPGARRNVFAAMGLQEAPFLSNDATSIDDRLEAVTDGKPLGVTEWLESRVNDLTTVDSGNFTRFRERLADRSDS